MRRCNGIEGGEGAEFDVQHLKATLLHVVGRIHCFFERGDDNHTRYGSRSVVHQAVHLQIMQRLRDLGGSRVALLGAGCRPRR